MNVNVIGGGPGGLYAALLLKKGHPDWTVRLYERNPRGATYGWGVVFSDRTLDALREADLSTYDQITESFVLWDAIDVHIHGELVRCNGNAFAGIGRRRLLEILNLRCEELGVELRHEQRVDDLDALPDSDLIIAADGVNSAVRERFAKRFQPRVALGDARYIWFGTDRVYDAFTFVFRDTEHGIFQAHAYPYDDRTSTFIVECRGETWERTGLAEDDEDANVRFCEELFADHLGAKRLMSNRSHWLRFPTLRTRRWSARVESAGAAGAVVLLGDAAHTAHFSIGSGTKLALEDAIALAEAFERHDDVPAALQDYELARRPRVQVLQDAAEESRDYFEHIARYYPFHPQQFGFHLLTRSGRITADNLRTRDPYFVARTEAWYSGQACDAHPAVAPPPAFSALKLGETTFPNRLVVEEPAGLVAIDGLPGAGHHEAYARLAESGAGAILTGRLAVAPEGRITPEDAGLYADETVEQWRPLVEAIHARSNALVIAHLAHAGRRGATRPRRSGIDLPLRDAWKLLAPSPLPYLPESPAPSEMSEADLERVRDAFSSAARNAAEAGFDALLLDMAHGYLLSSFLSPLTNRRDDEYGGDCERRLRYPLEVLAAVRAAWPEDRPLLVGINGSDRARGGLSPDDAAGIARELRAHGADMLAIHAGQVVPGERHDYAPASLAQLSDTIRNESGVPTLATAYMDTTNMPNTLLASGRADLCLFRPRGWDASVQH